jgi:hypothetical protein
MSYETKISPDLRLRSQFNFRLQRDRSRMPFTFVNETQSRLPSAILAFHHYFFCEHLFLTLESCVMLNANVTRKLTCSMSPLGWSASSPPSRLHQVGPTPITTMSFPSFVECEIMAWLRSTTVRSVLAK